MNQTKTSEKWSEKLPPCSDDQKVTRVDNRIGEAAPDLTCNWKLLIVIPRNNRLPDVFLVDWYHCKFLNANRETKSISSFRYRIFVQWCTKSSKSARALRGNKHVLHLSSVTPSIYSSAFTYAGFEYFESVTVKRARLLMILWIAMFTCLSVRTHNLKVVHSLSSGSWKLTIRRLFFIRRIQNYNGSTLALA